ncbi:MAG: hypothetical protein OHK0023_08560 [Anaerolineae bacterium]
MRTNRPPFLIAALLIALGGYLLLRNFRLMPAIDLSVLAPLLLALLGLQLLMRGDLGLSWASQPFGITRGTVRGAQLEVWSGEIDVILRPLRREGRLIGGAYTARSRPSLEVRGDVARLSMQRGKTWLISQAAWEVGLSRDLPWNLLMSSFLGETDLDLRGISIHRAELGTGFGDMRIVLPEECIQGVRAYSTFGNVTLVVPDNVEAMIRLVEKPFSRALIDEKRFIRLDEGVYATLNYLDATQLVYAEVATTFGTVRLI